ncbi:hypothetical protein H6504_04655 [Candidatus Woesearchaeota archaeon]|nr:hypothetical protein [Candidatus Woesearchaeota archaeon]
MIAPAVSFEVEAYLTRDERIFYYPSKTIPDFFRSKVDWDIFNPVANFMMEGKTYPRANDIEQAARRALENLAYGVDLLGQHLSQKNISFQADSRLYDLLPDSLLDYEEAGTHVHLDYKPIAKFFEEQIYGKHAHRTVKDHYRECMVWEMKKQVGRMAGRYCYSERFSRRLHKAMVPDLGEVDINETDRQTANARSAGTIEFVFPDSTSDISSLIDLGSEIRRIANDAAEKIANDSDYCLPSETERKAIMRIILRDYI